MDSSWIGQKVMLVGDDMGAAAGQPAEVLDIYPGSETLLVRSEATGAEMYAYAGCFYRPDFDDGLDYSESHALAERATRKLIGKDKT